MKYLMFSGSILASTLLFSLSSMAISEEKAVRQAVKQFVQAGDQNDTTSLTTILAPAFRIVWNDITKQDVQIVDRGFYLKMIGEKKWGGDQRKISFESVEVFENGNATAKIVLDGAKADFYSFLSLAKHKEGWKIVQDLTIMK